MVLNKKHYYDGQIYHIFCDKALKDIKKIIFNRIKPNTEVIDIACGTGSLVFDLAEKCKKVIGIELSLKMINYANQFKHKIKKDNVQFLHKDATNLSNFKNKQFDYAVISMALHEMPYNLRIKVLNETKRIANKIILADYTTPQPSNIYGFGNQIVEFLAGIKHFNCFRDFQKNNRLDNLIKELEFSVESNIFTKNKTKRIVVVS